MRDGVSEVEEKGALMIRMNELHGTLGEALGEVVCIRVFLKDFITL